MHKLQCKYFEHSVQGFVQSPLFYYLNHLFVVSASRTKIGKMIPAFRAAGSAERTHKDSIARKESASRKGSQTFILHHPEPTDAALNQHIIILCNCHLPANEARLQLASWLTIAVDELKRVYRFSYYSAFK